MISTPTTAIRLLGRCYQAFMVIATRHSTKDARKDDRHVKNGQHVAGVSSAMLQPSPSNEVLIICRTILFPSCLRTISSSPWLIGIQMGIRSKRLAVLKRRG